jgi:L-rhamnose mutarotase
MRSWRQLAQATLDARDAVDLAHLANQLIEIIFDVHENLVADDEPSSFARIQQHPICKAWTQIMLRLTCATPGEFGYKLDLREVEKIAYPNLSNPEENRGQTTSAHISK